MDFLKKAKASLKDLEGDLNKATASLGLGNKDGVSSMNTTPAGTTMNTPYSSVAPSVAPSVVADGPKVKLPLAARKSVRDGWDTPKPELEAKITALLGVRWTAPIDVGMVYSYAKDGFAKENPGKLFAQYIEAFIDNVETYLKKFGQDGKTELNNIASNHTIVLEPTDDKKITWCACDITNGNFRILFAKDYLGTNVRSATSEIAQAVNEAGIAMSSASGSGMIPLDFDAKSSIQLQYAPKIEEVKARLQKLFAMPVLTLTPNFEHNFAAVSKHAQGDGASDLQREWQKQVGYVTAAYFEGLAHQVEYAGFGKDAMLQEGVQEAVEKNEIQVRVVDKLTRKTYNEVVIENGIMVIQMIPKWWATNANDVGSDLTDIL